MVAPLEQKYCFVIGPIGTPESEDRRLADWLLQCIIKPALEAEPFLYKVDRADEFTEPGMITDQVITSTMDADLVIADLTNQNANAFYELAVRHMAAKPVIHMILEGQSVPFDIKDYRAVSYNINRPSDLEEAQSELIKQVKAIEQPDYVASNPITKARGHQDLALSGDSRDKVLADIVEKSDRTEGRMSKLESHLSRVVEILATSFPASPSQIVSPFVYGLQGRPLPSQIGHTLITEPISPVVEAPSEVKEAPEKKGRDEDDEGTPS